MAEMVLDSVTKKIEEEYNVSFLPCQTKHLSLSGGEFGGSQKFERFVKQKVEEGTKIGLDRKQAEKLAKRYGSNVDKVFEYVKNGEHANVPPAVYAQVMYGLEYEMVVKPVDFFIRRTGALFFNISWVHEWKVEVINLMASKLGWTREQKELYRQELEKHLHDAVVPVDEEDDTALAQ